MPAPVTRPVCRWRICNCSPVHLQPLNVCARGQTHNSMMFSVTECPHRCHVPGNGRRASPPKTRLTSSNWPPGKPPTTCGSAALTPASRCAITSLLCSCDSQTMPNPANGYCPLSLSHRSISVRDLLLSGRRLLCLASANGRCLTSRSPPAARRSLALVCTSLETIGSVQQKQMRRCLQCAGFGSLTSRRALLAGHASATI